MFLSAILAKYGAEGNYDDEGDGPSLLDEAGRREAVAAAMINFRLSMKDGECAILPREWSFLSLGSIGCAYNKDELVKAGITHVLCLADKARLSYPDSFCL